MDTSNLMQSQLDQARNSYDINGLDVLRQGARKNDREALEETAKQFESIFLHMMLKSMRAAEDVLADEDSPFNSQQVRFYRDMHDQQLATNMAATGNVGLADVIVQQLDPQGSGVIPASALRSGANIEQFRGQQQPNLNEVEAAIQSALGTENSRNAGVPSKQAGFGSPEEFVESLLPIAQQVAKDIGLDPKAMVAQAAVETGWGQYMIHSGDGRNSHNLFGVKASRGWQGEKHYVDTLEFQGETAHKTKAAFRGYDSFEHAMHDYVDFLKSSPRYSNALQQTNEPAQYFSELQQAGYATDPGYKDKVMSVLNSERLNQVASGLGI
ncbi:MAG: flagellar assembly peptidoglycan hydrolase FlgJ [Aestuariibacter sp.]